MKSRGTEFRYPTMLKNSASATLVDYLDYSPSSDAATVYGAETIMHMYAYCRHLH